jgi:hypothetical protein
VPNASEGLSSADRALLGYLEGRGEPVGVGFWDCFRAAWGEALRKAWESSVTDHRPGLDSLRAERAAEAGPDLERVHPSWFVRALKDESPAVQRSVVAHAPPELRVGLQAGLELSDADLRTDSPPNVAAVRWASVLWHERLVGGLAERADDPPVIVALTWLRARDALRLVRAAGLAKWSAAGEDTSPPLRELDRRRYEEFAGRLGQADPGLAKLADRDLAALDRSGRHPFARLGLVTVARLLEVVEPFRVRWALQHIPYPLAKQTRARMPARRRREPSLEHWESQVLRVAWERLRGEGRLPSDWRWAG